MHGSLSRRDYIATLQRIGPARLDEAGEMPYTDDNRRPRQLGKPACSA
jgi:hypothetical protein